jgi:uncharacterized protein
MDGVEISTKPMDLSGFTLILGFPDVGLAGAIAAEHVADKAGMRELGHLSSERLPPLSVVEEGVVARPITVYACQRRKLVLIRSYIHLPPRLAHMASRALVAWAKRAGVAEIVCLSGYLADEGTEPGDDVYVAASTKDVLATERLQHLFRKGGVYPWTGSVYGVVGQVLLDAMDAGVPAFSLVVETKADYPDARAAAKSLRVLNRYLNLRIDLEPLMEEANLIEEQVKAVADSASRLHQQMEQFAGSNLMYR